MGPGARGVSYYCGGQVKVLTEEVTQIGWAGRPYLEVENKTNGEVLLKAAAVVASRLAAVSSKRILNVCVLLRMCVSAR